MRSPNPKGSRRAQEDDLVDRLEVEVQQCMQLTSTNRPFGLSIEFTLRSGTLHGLVSRSGVTLGASPVVIGFSPERQSKCNTPIYAVVKDRLRATLRQLKGETQILERSALKDFGCGLGRPQSASVCR